MTDWIEGRLINKSIYRNFDTIEVLRFNQNCNFSITVGRGSDENLPWIPACAGIQALTPTF